VVALSTACGRDGHDERRDDLASSVIPASVPARQARAAVDAMNANRSLGVARFRKRPVVIEAMRYTLESRDAVIAWSGATGTAIDDDGAEYDLQNIRIPTLEGTMQADLGDWIIRGVAGEFYPCKPDIFEATYEPA
jgi:hypothetical protein